MDCKTVVEDNQAVLWVEQKKPVVRLIGRDVHAATLKNLVMTSSDCKPICIRISQR